MENATVDTAAPAPADNAVVDTTPDSTVDAKSTEAPKAEVKTAPKAEEKAHRLHEILEAEKKDPNQKLNAADQAIYDQYVDNKLAPVKKQEPKEPEAKEPEAKEKAEVKEPEVKEVAKVEKPAISPELEATMKEVGAKTLEELPAKIKELRARVSGKETEAVTQIKQEMTRKATNEAALWRDFIDGNPSAIAYVEKEYGLKPKIQQAQPQTSQDFDPEVLADADALTGGITSKVIAQNKALQERLERLEGTFEGHQKTIKEQGVRQTVAAQVVDEMIGVASKLDGVKDIPNLRNAIIDRVVHGKVDPRLDAFNEIFQVAEESGTSLENAYLILQGRNAAFLIEQAKQAGRKEAYSHTPNKSLSAVVTEDAQSQQYTDEQYEAMSKNFRLIPNEFLDKAGNLDKSKIPKKGWAHFDL